MFEQHPVPQNISSYQFHLVGDMTLKQFLELASGVVVGVIIYATGLPALIKWPLILFFVAGGGALAFVPFEERPLEQWIIAFFRSVYSPTLFHWRKVEGIKYFQSEEVAVPEVKGGKPTSFISNIPFLAKLESAESAYLSRFTQLFSPQGASMQSVQPVVNTQPQVQPQAAPTENLVVNAPTMMGGGNQGSVLTMQAAGPTPVPMAPTSVKKDINIPQTNLISLNKNQRPGLVVEEVNQAPTNLETTSVSQTLQGQATQGLKEAQFSTQAAPPSVPTIPNTVSGQVMDASGNVVDGAILEIRDDKGRPVRALRSNKAGHFLTVTSLTPGTYQIVIEKEGLSFDPISFETAGQIIQPIAIRAK